MEKKEIVLQKNKTRNSVLLSVGESFAKANNRLAPVVFADGVEGHIWKLTEAEIDDIRKYIGQEVPFAFMGTSESGMTMISIYVGKKDEVKKEEPKKQEVPAGYANIEAAKKKRWMDDKEDYWGRRDEREEKRAEINDAEYRRRHYENLVQPFFLEYYKLQEPKAEDTDKLSHLKSVIDTMMVKAKELYDDK